MNYDDVTLGTIARGALEEKFAQELERVIRNIDDPNTPAEAKRTIDLRLTLKPDKSRQAISVTAKASTKLAPSSEVSTVIWLVHGPDGRLQAKEHNPLQTGLDFGAGAGGDDKGKVQ